MLRNIVICAVVALATLVGASSAYAQWNRHFGSECVYMGTHSDVAQGCVYHSEGGIANACTDRDITVVCPLVSQSNTSYQGDTVRVYYYDANGTANFSGQLFAKSILDWAWTNCGSTQSSSGTGSGYIDLSFCQDYSWTTDFHGLRIVIPRKYSGAMSAIYGYAMVNN